MRGHTVDEVRAVFVKAFPEISFTFDDDVVDHVLVRSADHPSGEPAVIAVKRDIPEALPAAVGAWREAWRLGPPNSTRKE